MDEEAKKIFKRIVKKEIPELTLDDRAFLRARASYLNKKQLEYFKEVLTISDEEKEMIRKAEVEELEREEFDADEANRLAHPAIRDETRVPYKELQKEAKELGLKSVGIKRKDLKENIEKAKKEKKAKKEGK